MQLFNSLDGMTAFVSTGLLSLFILEPTFCAASEGHRGQLFRRSYDQTEGLMRRVDGAYGDRIVRRSPIPMEALMGAMSHLSLKRTKNQPLEEKQQPLNGHNPLTDAISHLSPTERKHHSSEINQQPLNGHKKPSYDDILANKIRFGKFSTPPSGPPGGYDEAMKNAAHPGQKMMKQMKAYQDRSRRHHSANAYRRFRPVMKEEKMSPKQFDRAVKKKLQRMGARGQSTPSQKHFEENWIDMQNDGKHKAIANAARQTMWDTHISQQDAAERVIMGKSANQIKQSVQSEQDHGKVSPSQH